MDYNEYVGKKIYFKYDKDIIIAKVNRILGTKVELIWDYLIQKKKRVKYPIEVKPLYDISILNEKTTRIIEIDKLVLGRKYGTVAHGIFIQCTNDLMFDVSKEGFFAAQKHLFAREATLENYDVWFICNSNYHPPEKEYPWDNVVSLNKDHIDEKWLDPTMTILNTGETKRIVFLKKGKDEGNQYEFIGIFQQYNIDNTTRVASYKRVGTKYPE